MAAINSDILEKQFKELYRPLCLYALNYTGNHDDAEDLVQQLFAELWEKSTAGGTDVANIKSYLYTAVKNRGIKHVQRARPTCPLDRVTDTAANDDDDIARVEREARLWDWIDALPPVRRDIFLMAKQRGMKYKEIADELHISVKTVENQMGKALQSLRARVVEIYLFLRVGVLRKIRS